MRHLKILKIAIVLLLLAMPFYHVLAAAGAGDTIRRNIIVHDITGRMLIIAEANSAEDLHRKVFAELKGSTPIMISENNLRLAAQTEPAPNNIVINIISQGPGHPYNDVAFENLPLENGEVWATRKLGLSEHGPREKITTRRSMGGEAPFGRKKHALALYKEKSPK